jgi:aspartyl-tRNA(Asn)/glutamyl-tRNA(Gln) amidotransferase subunit A
MAGPHPADDLSYPSSETRYVAAATEQRDLSQLRVAWSVDVGCAPVEPDVRARFREAVATFGRIGCELVEAHPPTGDPVPLWTTLATIEGYASERRIFERSPSLVEPGTAEIIRAGEGKGALEYFEAQYERGRYTRAWLEFFEEFDLLLTPMMQLTAFPVAIAAPSQIDGVPVDPFFDDWCHLCYPANLTGQPAISLPNGFGHDGLPVGLQITARRFDEVTLLAAAAAWERLAPWAHALPPLVAELDQPRSSSG